MRRQAHLFKWDSIDVSTPSASHRLVMPKIETYEAEAGFEQSVATIVASVENGNVMAIWHSKRRKFMAGLPI